MAQEGLPERAQVNPLEQEKESEISLLQSETRDKFDSLQEDLEMKDQIQETVRAWLQEGTEWLREKISQNNDNIASLLVVILDEVLEKVKPDREDEFGDRQDREDLLEFAGGEAALESMLSARAIEHKLNTIEKFEEAIAAGKNLEFDLRVGHNKEALIQHNSV